MFSVLPKDIMGGSEGLHKKQLMPEFYLVILHISLYADDMILCVNNAVQCISQKLYIFYQYGKLSVFKIILLCQTVHLFQ